MWCNSLQSWQRPHVTRTVMVAHHIKKNKRERKDKTSFDDMKAASSAFAAIFNYFFSFNPRVFNLCRFQNYSNKHTKFTARGHFLSVAKYNYLFIREQPTLHNWPWEHSFWIRYSHGWQRNVDAIKESWTVLGTVEKFWRILAVWSDGKIFIHALNLNSQGERHLKIFSYPKTFLSKLS